MNKIIVKHTSIIINNYNIGDSIKLENNFTVYDKITHSYFLKGVEYVEDEKKLILPRGIDVFYLENIFQCKAVMDTSHDPMDFIDKVNIKYLPRDEIQEEAIAFMSGNTTKYKKNKNYSQFSVNLNTGKGKSYCSIINSAIHSIRSAVITSSINWLNQWKNYILEYTDIKSREIFTITGTPSIQRILSKDMSQYKFILISHNTIKSYGDSFGWNKVSELFNHLKIGIKYFDEAHLNFVNMSKIDFYTNTYKTYYVTATPARSDKDENAIFQLYFKNVPAIDLFDENEDPHTNYIAIRYNSRPAPYEISECKNQYGLDRNKYTNYITGKDNYYKMIRIILDILFKKKGKSLIYIGTNKAIFKTYEWISYNYPELINDIGIYTSAIPEDEKINQLNKKIILSTTKSTGTAMDIKGLECTVVLAEPFKSEVLARQTLGRTRSNNTLYIEVVDTGFNQILKYYYYKKPIFEKYALSCTEINIKQNELDYRSEQLILQRNQRFNPFIASVSKQVFVKTDKLRNPFIRSM